MPHPAEGQMQWWMSREQRQAVRDQYDRQQAALTDPGTLGRGVGPVSQEYRPGGMTEQDWQNIYGSVGGQLEVAGGRAKEYTRQQSVAQLLGVQGGDFMQQLQSGVSDWMADPQAWSDAAQRMMETGIREEGTQQLRGQKYDIGRSMAQRGMGDSGTRLKLEQRAASAQDAATLEAIREAKVAREQENLKSKALAYHAGLGVSGQKINIAGMIADTYMGTTYDPSGAQALGLAGELMPVALQAGQFATGQQKQGMDIASLMALLGMAIPGQDQYKGLF